MSEGGAGRTTPVGTARGYWTAAAAVAVAVALWPGLSTAGVGGFAQTPGLWSPGGLGVLCWRALQAISGPTGGELLGRLAAALLLLIALKHLLGTRWGARGHRFYGLCLVAGTCALLPPGPDALLLPWAVGIVVLPLPLALALAFAGPFFTPLAVWGALAAAVAAWEEGRRRRAAVLAALAWMNPLGMKAILDGSAFRPLLLGWSGDPWSGWVASHPAAWLLPLWMVTAAVWASGRHEGNLVRAAALGGLSFVCRPFAGLSCLGAIRENASLRPPFWLSLAGIPAVLLTLASPPPPPPEAAAAWMKTVPSGSVVRVNAAWLRALSIQAPEGVAVVGAIDARPLWRERGVRLAPPFADAPAPQAGVVLLEAHYPDVRSPRPYREGWRLVALGPEWAAFARLPVPGGWTPRAYDPFQPLPAEETQRQQALAEALALAAADPRFFEAQRDSGRILLDLGRHAEALDRLQAALALRSRSASLLNDVATALHQLGRGPEAEAFYIRSIKEDPQELLPRMNLAGLYAGLGRTADAEMVLKDLIEKRPGFVAARRMLIQVYLETGRVDEAVAEVRAIPPDSRTPQENQLAGGAPVPGANP